MTPADGRYLGLISGTSCDGIDAALIEVAGNTVRLVDAFAGRYEPGLRTTLLELPERPQLSLGEFGALDNAVAEAFAEAARTLLERQPPDAPPVTAIGSHGQNVWHAPAQGLSLQLGNPSLIAARTGITTVADFRRKDVALGGQGAPLAPAFHRATLGAADESRWVLNLGGIANLTRLDRGPLLGFDTGPANGLMDAGCQRHTGKPYDSDGDWAASGTVDEALLDRLMADDYFRRPPPKSTGREHFNPGWLDRALAEVRTPSEADVQRTLLELTVRSVLGAMAAAGGEADRLLVCGGGAANGALMRRLAEQARCPVQATDTLGVPADWLEAMAFAWFAANTLAGQPTAVASVTGAERDAVLGGIFHA